MSLSYSKPRSSFLLLLDSHCDTNSGKIFERQIKEVLVSQCGAGFNSVKTQTASDIHVPRSDLVLFDEMTLDSLLNSL